MLANILELGALAAFFWALENDLGPVLLATVFYLICILGPIFMIYAYA